MVQLNDLACHLLRVEQQLIAYQKLHTDELAELWQTLNQCKREIADALSEAGIDIDPSIPTSQGDSDQQAQTGEKQESPLSDHLS